MRMKFLIICLLFPGLSFGCFSHKCDLPLSNINKIIINVDTSTALIQEQYLQGNYLEALKKTIRDSTEYEIVKHFSNSINKGGLSIEYGTDCQKNAVIVYGVLLSIDSGSVRRPRRIYGSMRGIVFNCSTDSSLADETISVRNNAFMDTPIELGATFGKLAIKKISKCE